MLYRDRLAFIQLRRDGGVYPVTLGELHPAVRRSPELKAEEFLNETLLSVGANDNIPATNTGLSRSDFTFSRSPFSRSSTGICLLVNWSRCVPQIWRGKTLAAKS